MLQRGEAATPRIDLIWRPAPEAFLRGPGANGFLDAGKAAGTVVRCQQPASLWRALIKLIPLSQPAASFLSIACDSRECTRTRTKDVEGWLAGSPLLAGASPTARVSIGRGPSRPFGLSRF